MGKGSAQAIALTVEKKCLAGGKTDRQPVTIGDVSRFRPLDDELLTAFRTGIDIAGIAEVLCDIDLDCEINITLAFSEKMLGANSKGDDVADGNRCRCNG